MIKKSNSGFSLLELSISLAIVAMIVSGVLTTRTILTQARLKNAERMSRSSPVLDIFNDKNQISAVAWFDATSADTITASGNVVSSWKSKISDVIATQSTSANQPTYSSTGLNGFPAIYFDRSDYLSMKAILASGDDTFTIAVVWQTSDHTSSPTAGTLWGQKTSNSDHDAAFHAYGTGTSPSSYGFYAKKVTSSVSISAYSLAPTISVSNPIVSVLIVDASDSTATNANSVTLYHFLTRYSSIVTDLYKLNIGNDAAFLGMTGETSSCCSFFKGFISEIIVFDKALSSKEAISVASYFMTKYRIVK